ncbi:MAG: TetR/AcrR family transcriptional regulator [Spirochaetes bacterium]|nr:TetR/AcrR family transcriptional regulator [Spirochaetota bacterium]
MTENVKFDEKDLLIIKCAKKEFILHGFHNAIMENISQDAGVGKGTVYRRFTNKKELFIAVLTYGYNEFIIKLQNIDFSIGFKELLYQYLRIHSDYILNNLEILSIKMHELSKIINDDEKDSHLEEMKKINSQLIGFWEKLLETGVRENIIRKEFELNTLAALMLNSARTIFFDLFMERAGIKPEIIEKRINYIMDILLNGIIKKDGN